MQNGIVFFLCVNHRGYYCIDPVRRYQSIETFSPVLYLGDTRNAGIGSVVYYFLRPDKIGDCPAGFSVRRAGLFD